ncbi:MAG: hypothetical protein J6S58_08200, partial [Lentisphaeria bacterium]|nr:hypothetical protein [Lentisphaeria bacterium]
IAILAGMLLPALNKARHSAKRSGCLGNIRQVAQGIHMYAGDSNDIIVTWQVKKGDNHDTTTWNTRGLRNHTYGLDIPWSFVIRDYIQLSLTRIDNYNPGSSSPVATKSRRGINKCPAMQAVVNYPGYVQYGMPRGEIGGTGRTGWNKVWRPPTRFGELRSASSLALLMDTAIRKSGSLSPGLMGSYNPNEIDPSDGNNMWRGMSSFHPGGEWIDTWRHRGMANCAFADGRAGSLAATYLQTQGNKASNQLERGELYGAVIPKDQ